MYVIGDVHGCYFELKSLISSLPNWEKEGICFVGDICDRGPDSAKVYDYVFDLIDSGYSKCVIGNHELMFMSWYQDYTSNSDLSNLSMIFMSNGGQETVNSYDSNKLLMEKHINRIQNLPPFLKFDISVNGKRDLIISHSTVLTRKGNLVDKIINAKSDYEIGVLQNEILWNREEPVSDGKTFNIFGHTPNQSIVVDNFYANVDVGVYMSGFISALHVPTLNIHTI